MKRIYQIPEIEVVMIYTSTNVLAVETSLPGEVPPMANENFNFEESNSSNELEKPNLWEN